MAWRHKKESSVVYLAMLLLMIALAVWLKRIAIESSWQQAGMINMSLAFVLLASYASAKFLKAVRLPLISVCIFTGIVAGPYVSGFLTKDMVGQMKLIDDLALSFIALTAGGELRLQSLKTLRKTILLNVLLQVVIVFCIVVMLIVSAGNFFQFTRSLSTVQLIITAVLIGVVAVARSPSSAIAIISECRASGPFTSTVLGVTVVMDVVIIILFTCAVAVSKAFMLGNSMVDIQVFLALVMEMMVSFVIGAALGKGISVYISRVGHDLPLFLLFLAFGVTKASLWLSQFMEGNFDISLHLEPLLICMSAGFFVQNFTGVGSHFMENLDRMALPIYVLFFSLAGAALNLESLRICWPLALWIAVVRAAGIFVASWIAGRFSGDPPSHRRYAWMSYVAQAGVAIGLAQLAQRQFPEFGGYLMTIVLAVISVNQIIGPITFKIALDKVQEAGKRCSL